MIFWTIWFIGIIVSGLVISVITGFTREKIEPGMVYAASVVSLCWPAFVGVGLVILPFYGVYKLAYFISEKMDNSLLKK